MAQDPLRTNNPTNEPNSTHFSSEEPVQKTTQASSDCDSEASNTVGLVGHSPPLSQVDDQVNDEFDDSNESSEGTIEDRRASEGWETVSDFASDMTGAAKKALFNRKTYFKKMVAVIVYWETSSGLEHLRDQADKLGRVFEDRFNFEVLVYKIPETIFARHFIKTISPELDKVVNDQDSLFILYYGGHASTVDLTRPQFTKVRLWKKETCLNSPKIDWSNVDDGILLHQGIL